MQWAMNYIVYDVRREGEAGGSPAFGFGFGNFSKVGVNWYKSLDLQGSRGKAKPSVGKKKQGFEPLLNIFANFDILSYFS